MRDLGVAGKNNYIYSSAVFTIQYNFDFLGL